MDNKNNIHVHPNIINRRSSVVFSSKEIEDEKIISLFEAARWAPSSYNEQPWRFIYATKKNIENYNKFIDCLMKENAEWAKYAPLLVLSIVKIKYALNNKLNYYSHYEAGMAVGNLLNQATFLGLYVHQMGGYDQKKARKTFKINNEYDLLTIMAIGYLGNPDDFPDNLQEREKRTRTRRELNEIVFLGEFCKKN